jgi:hypothetical protein
MGRKLVLSYPGACVLSTAGYINEKTISESSRRLVFLQDAQLMVAYSGQIGLVGGRSILYTDNDGKIRGSRSSCVSRGSFHDNVATITTSIS